jgi:hypothetical protein
MNLLVYLRFLRPLRSLIFIAVYTALVKVLGRDLLHLDPSRASFFALAVTLPLLLGFFIAGAAHEPMHRPFALVLPNIRRRQRMAAMVSVLIAALAATCGSTWVGSTVSPVATFGLACALIALPCVNRRQFLFVQAGGVAAFLGCLWLGLAAVAKLALTMNSVPWLFLIGGLAICAASLIRGFSRESLRGRASTLFIAYQTIVFSYLFHRGMVARWQAEMAAHKNIQKKGRSALGRDWPIRLVGTKSLDWMRVFWHANFGRRKQNSFLHVQLMFSIITLVVASIFLGFMHIFGQKEFWATLGQLATLDQKMFTTKMAGALRVNFLMLQPAMAVVCALLLARPQLPFPISRKRLAQVVFWQAVVQWASALVVPAGTIFLVSLIGQAMAGKPLLGYGLPALLAVDLPLAALLPLLVAADTIRWPSLRILSAIPIVLAIMLMAVTRPHWTNYVLTLSGILGMLVATAGSQWLLWHRLHRQYATSDLPLETGFVPLFVPGLSVRAR